MSNNPGWDAIRKKFNELNQKYSTAGGVKKIRKSVAAGVKSVADNVKNEFPKSDIENFFNDVYGVVASTDISNGVSMAFQSMSRDDVKNALDRVVANLADERVAKNIAKSLKDISKQASYDELKAQIEVLTEKLPMQQQMAIQAVLVMAKPLYEQLQYMDEAQIAETIQQSVGMLPTDQVADQFYQVVMNVTPERITALTQTLLSKAPSGKLVSDVAHGFADVFSKQAARFANNNVDAKQVAADFGNDLRDLIQKATNDDSKQNIRKDDGFTIK